MMIGMAFRKLKGMDPAVPPTSTITEILRERQISSAHEISDTNLQHECSVSMLILLHGIINAIISADPFDQLESLGIYVQLPVRPPKSPFREGNLPRHFGPISKPQPRKRMLRPDVFKAFARRRTVHRRLGEEPSWSRPCRRKPVMVIWKRR